ncbi:hypothetical protein CEXT_416451 [Caerostris extrusa]|uniref:Uncharacterized protein n=1 Tax=Caerostris extrusa TaxID=172846 RepID=A0AAV4Y9L3_CAEEX|nr:hypothetical protein CEXT_416451 [Caerostris extrusa]
MSHRNLLQGTQRQDHPNDRHFQNLPVRIKTEGRVQRHETKTMSSRNLERISLNGFAHVFWPSKLQFSK